MTADLLHIWDSTVMSLITFHHSYGRQQCNCHVYVLSFIQAFSCVEQEVGDENVYAKYMLLRQ